MSARHSVASLLVLAAIASPLLAAPVWASPPTRTGDTFTFSDGVRVRAVDPSGHAGTVQKDGSIRYSDGTSV
ncbi:MAG TPA: hypothetical protein VHB46_12330, partial [Burkholderiales bacterium]|nr:hypothetical protein [Burkholderiales bacterium]